MDETPAEAKFTRNGISSLHWNSTVIPTNKFQLACKKNIHVMYNPTASVRESSPHVLEHPDWYVLWHGYVPVGTFNMQHRSIININGIQHQIELRKIYEDIEEKFVFLEHEGQQIAIFFPRTLSLYTLWVSYDMHPEVHMFLLEKVYNRVLEFMGTYTLELPQTDRKVFESVVKNAPRYDEKKLSALKAAAESERASINKSLAELSARLNKINTDLLDMKDNEKISQIIEHEMALYQKLLDEGMYEKISVQSPTHVIAIAKNCVIDGYGPHTYKVTIDRDQIYMSNLSRKDVHVPQGPYQDTHANAMCWGNIKDKIHDLLKRRLYAELLMLIREYLGWRKNAPTTTATVSST